MSKTSAILITIGVVAAVAGGYYIYQRRKNGQPMFPVQPQQNPNAAANAPVTQTQDIAKQTASAAVSIGERWINNMLGLENSD